MKRLLAASIAVLALLAAAQPAQAQFFSVQCTPGTLAQIDPLVAPGVPVSAHMHLFFGNQSVTPDSTTASMMAATTTTCHVPADTAGIWAPAPFINGQHITPSFIADYWTSVPNHQVQPWPAGLYFVAGNADATAPPPENVLFWNCGTGQTPNVTTPPPICPRRGPGLNAHLVFPNCWDGTGLTPADLSYPSGFPKTFAKNPPGSPCPAGFPVLLPVLQEIIHFGHIDASTLSFSSGPYYTLHVDYWQTWNDQAELSSLVTNCLNHNVGCGTQ